MVLVSVVLARVFFLIKKKLAHVPRRSAEDSRDPDPSTPQTKLNNN